MILSGSQQWQHYLFAFAALFLLWQLWRGWQLGAVRGLLRLAALFCAWIGGSMAAGATGTFMTFFSKVPPLLAPGIAAISVGLAIYLVLTILSGLLFKRTEHHVGVVRWGFGLGGALFGVIYGALFLFGGISLIRGLGALGEMRVVQARNEGRSLSSEQRALFLIKLKESLELGETGKSLQGLDPLPSAFYDDFVKMSQVMGNPAAAQRLIQYPSVLELVKNPKVLAFLQDPALQKAADSRNIFPLLQNTNLQALIQDPQILTLFRKINITEALDHALNPPLPQTQTGKLPKPSSTDSPAMTTQGKNSPSPISTAP
jgi:hypothetical protein